VLLGLGSVLVGAHFRLRSALAIRSMALEGCLSSTMAQNSSLRAVPHSSQWIQNPLNGCIRLPFPRNPFPLQRSRVSRQSRRGLSLQSAGAPEGQQSGRDENAQRMEKRNIQDKRRSTPTNKLLKPGLDLPFWRAIPEARDFSQGKLWTDPDVLRRTLGDKRRPEDDYTPMLGQGLRGDTTDPKLLRMLNYRLTSGEHKGKMLREVPKRYLEWLATSAAPVKPLKKGELNKVILRSKDEVVDVADMAAIVLQLPEIKDTVRQVDIEDIQEAALKGRSRPGQASADVYKAALLRMKSLDIQVALEKQAKEEKRHADRLAVKAGRIADPTEARRLKRRVKQWDEAESQKREGLAETIEERLQRAESEAEEALKSNYGVVPSQSTRSTLQPGQLPAFKGRDEMLSIAQQAMWKGKLQSSKPKDADPQPERSAGGRQLPSSRTSRRPKGPARKGGPEDPPEVDWRDMVKRKK
jgi:uncharacterized protein (DUF3820 family)